jgi:AcrR family transcriptional regulator
VDVVLDAVTLVLKRHGPDAVTTNRIAEAAGVSIGSLYQYFPDKQAIYRALHERHVDDVRRVIDRALAERASGLLEDFARALVEGLAEVHAGKPPKSWPIGGYRNGLLRLFARSVRRRLPGARPHPRAIQPRRCCTGRTVATSGRYGQVKRKCAYWPE